MKTLYIHSDGYPHPSYYREEVPFLVSEDLWALWYQWHEEPASRDGQTSGVLADWIEDHPEHWECESPEAVARCLKWLRLRYSAPDCNRNLNPEGIPL